MKQLRIRKIILALPELWFIVVFVGCMIGNVNYLTDAGWQLDAMLLPLFLLVAVCMLIKQLFRANGWVTLFFGGLLMVGSCLMSLALLSEYNEVPQGNEPNALNLLVGGIPLMAVSLVLAAMMWIKGLRTVRS